MNIELKEISVRELTEGYKDSQESEITVILRFALNDSGLKW